jgi:ABC-type sugar transport system permease subunit
MKLKSTINYNLQNTVLFFPGFAIYVGLVILSIFLCFYYSFFDWNGIRKTMDFVGFNNYIFTLQSKEFLRSVKVTFFYAIFGTLIANVVSLVLAFFLNRKTPLMYGYRAAFFFPQLISMVAVGFIFKALLSYIGIVNMYLEQFGMAKIDFIGNPALAPWTVLGISIWQVTGFATVLYLAGLQAIPGDIFDAAKIDGINTWQKFWYISFPWLAPSFTSVTILLFTGYMKIFDIIFVMTGGGPAGRTQSIAQFILKVGVSQYRVSYASAIAIYMMLLVATISIALTTLLRKREENIIS